jgi:GSH-dependent disulfide-bond oxidoreductase
MRRYLSGDKRSIAGIGAHAWYGSLAAGKLYDALAFLDVSTYSHVQRWAKEILQRPAVQRGRRVNRGWGKESEQPRERHDASDLE